MEWVETTGKSLDEAKDAALDRLGIVAEDAEFEVLEEPRAGLFGRVRGEARVRARVRPAAVRPKQDRRGRRRTEQAARRQARRRPSVPSELATVDSAADAAPPRGEASRRGTANAGEGPRARQRANGDTQAGPTDAGAHMNDDPIDAVTDGDAGDRPTPSRSTQVKEAAVSFIRRAGDGLRARGLELGDVEGNEIEVRIDASTGRVTTVPTGSVC